MINDALYILPKTELAPYFEGTDNDCLRKVTDINPPRFHGQQNWAFCLSK